MQMRIEMCIETHQYILLSLLSLARLSPSPGVTAVAMEIGESMK